MLTLVIDHAAVLASNRALYRHLAARGMSLAIVTPSEWREPYALARFEPEPSALRLVKAPSIFKGKSHRVLYPGLSLLFASLKPDCVFANAEPESFLAAQVLAARALLRLRYRIVLESWRNMDLQAAGYPYRLSRLHAWHNQLAAKYADCCIARTEATRAMLVEGGFSNVVLIPPAVDTDTFHPSTARKAADHPFTVGYVGRLVPEKGVDILLRAASHVDPLPKVLIVGDGPERLHLEILAQQLDLQRVVHWRGKTAHSNVPTSLRELDVLILPSRTTPTWKEQFGRVLIEAMACGIPVVGSDSGEIPNTIGSAGLTFPEGNISALASVLQRMHDDQHLALDLSARSRRRAEECFSVESVAEQYLSFFNSVCASKPLNL